MLLLSNSACLCRIYSTCFKVKFNYILFNLSLSKNITSEHLEILLKCTQVSLFYCIADK